MRMPREEAPLPLPRSESTKSSGESLRLMRYLRGEDGSPVTLASAHSHPDDPCPCLLQLSRTSATISSRELRECSRACPREPGRDFNVITISIDDRETPADARRAKRIGLESIEKPFPPESWRFLTGTVPNIAAVADSVGFRFVRRDTYFDHPVGIIILSPAGKIVRYMNGADFLPGGPEAVPAGGIGRAGGADHRAFLRICFSYDPASHKLVFNMLQVVATVTISVAGAFIIYLVLAGRKKRRQADAPRHTQAPGA